MNILIILKILSHFQSVDSHEINTVYLIFDHIIDMCKNKNIKHGLDRMTKHGLEQPSRAFDLLFLITVGVYWESYYSQSTAERGRT